MPFPSGWRTAGRQPELRKNKDLLLELGKGVGSSRVPRQPPAEPRCAARRREVRLRWRHRAPGPEREERHRRALEPHMGFLRFPWVCVPFSRKPAAARSRLLPAQPHMLPSYALGKLHRSPSWGAPKQHHPHPVSSQREERGRRAPAPQEAAPAAAPNTSTHQWPPPCPAWGRSQGSAAAGTSTSHPKTTPPPCQNPVMCTWRGKEINPTPQLGDKAQTPNSQTAVHKGMGRLSTPGWAQPPVPAALAGLGMSWPWPLVLLGIIKPFTWLGFQIHRRRQALRDSWLGTCAVGRGSRHGTGVGAAAGSRLRSEPDFGSSSSARAGSQRRGHLRSPAGQGAAGAPGALPGPGEGRAGCGERGRAGSAATPRG